MEQKINCIICEIGVDFNFMYIKLLSFIRPVLEYADVIWNNCTQYESNELEKIRMKRRVLSPVQQSWFHLTLSYQKQAGKLFRQGGTNIN